MIHFLFSLCIFSSLSMVLVTEAFPPAEGKPAIDGDVYKLPCKSNECGWKSLTCTNGICDFKPGLDGAKYLGKECKQKEECGNAGLVCNYDESVDGIWSPFKATVEPRKCMFAIAGSDAANSGKPCDSRYSSSSQCGLGELYCINDKCIKKK